MHLFSVLSLVIFGSALEPALICSCPSYISCHMDYNVGSAYLAICTSNQSSILHACAGASIVADAADQPAQAAPKRKKKRADDGQAVMTGGIEQSQRAQLDGHTDAATSVAWAEAGVIYSGSMDHSVILAIRFFYLASAFICILLMTGLL